MILSSHDTNFHANDTSIVTKLIKISEHTPMLLAKLQSSFLSYLVMTNGLELGFTFLKNDI